MDENLEQEFRKFCLENELDLPEEMIDLIATKFASSFLMQKVHDDYWDVKFEALENKVKYEGISSLLYILIALKNYVQFSIEANPKTLVGTVYLRNNPPFYIALNKQQFDLLELLKVIKIKEE